MTAETAPDIAPKTGGVKIVAPARTRTDRAPKTGRKKSLAKPLTEFFTSIGSFVAIANQADGIAIIEGAERLAKALDAVAKDNATVYKNLERMVTGSTWGGVIFAASAIVVPILANHNLLPFQIPGFDTGETMPNADWAEVGGSPNGGGIQDDIPDIGSTRVGDL